MEFSIDKENREFGENRKEIEEKQQSMDKHKEVMKKSELENWISQEWSSRMVHSKAKDLGLRVLRRETTTLAEMDDKFEEAMEIGKACCPLPIEASAFAIMETLDGGEPLQSPIRDTSVRPNQVRVYSCVCILGLWFEIDAARNAKGAGICGDWTRADAP